MCHVDKALSVEIRWADCHLADCQVPQYLRLAETHRRAISRTADRNECIANMKHKNETSGERAVTGPIREPRGLGHPGNHQRYVEDGGLWLHHSNCERECSGAVGRSRKVLEVSITNLAINLHQILN